jgi:tetratricopeptide (TPR) repeat protein
MPTGIPRKASYSPVKPEGSRASAPAGRGNIVAVGESLLVKQMLASNDPEEVKNTGNDQYKKGNFAEALSLYDRAVSLAPDCASYRSNKAATLISLGRLTEAYQECEESLNLDPLYTRAQQRLVSLCIR